MSYRKMSDSRPFTIGFTEKYKPPEGSSYEGESSINDIQESPYRKVQNGGQVFEVTDQIYPSGESEPILGKSWISCPRCSGKLLSPCNCKGVPPNYACMTCGWSYLNHRHQSKASG